MDESVPITSPSGRARVRLGTEVFLVECGRHAAAVGQQDSRSSDGPGFVRGRAPPRNQARPAAFGRCHARCGTGLDQRQVVGILARALALCRPDDTADAAAETVRCRTVLSPSSAPCRKLNKKSGHGWLLHRSYPSCFTAALPSRFISVIAFLSISTSSVRRLSTRAKSKPHLRSCAMLEPFRKAKTRFSSTCRCGPVP